MKYIKNFENITEFKKGDIVKCVNNRCSLYFNKVGVMDHISVMKYITACDVHFPDNKKALIEIQSLTKATPEEIEKYNLEKEMNKYNL